MVIIHLGQHVYNYLYLYMKQIIRLTEGDIHRMVMETLSNIIQINESTVKSALAESRQKALNEIDHREATDALCDNMNAKDELRRGNDVGIDANGTVFSYYDKRNASSKLIYKRLTQGVIDNVGEKFLLQFEREEPDESTTEVKFYFTEVILLTDDRVVLQGDAIMNRSDVPLGKKKPKVIQIDYKFKEQKFYEAVYCQNNTVRDLRPINLDIAGVIGRNNILTAERLIHFLTLCYYSKEDAKTTISQKPPMSGKVIKPFSH